MLIDARLDSVELAPVQERLRVLTRRHTMAFWGALTVSPMTYAFAAGHNIFHVALVLVSVGLMVAYVHLVSRSAVTYGVGFVPLSRAIFGARGAAFVVVWRILASSALLCGWSFLLARNLGSLLQITWPNVLTTWHFSGPDGLPVAGWLAAGLFIFMGASVASGGLSRIGRFAFLGQLLAALLCYGLVVWAGVESKGFGTFFASFGHYFANTKSLLAEGACLTLVGALSASDWLRYQRRGSLLTTRLESAWALPVTGGLVLVGMLLSAASVAMRGRYDGELIVDVVAFGGILGGVAALVVTLFLWLAAVPLVGFYSSALALHALRPQKISYRAAHGWLALVFWSVTPWFVGNVPMTVLHEISLLGVPCVGMFLADEWWVRRGRLVVDELYQDGRRYGPLWGFSLAATLAWVAGLLAHPWFNKFAIVVLPQDPWLRLWSGAVLAGIIYGVLAPLERHFFLRDRQEAPKKKRRPSRINEGTPTAALTDPHYVMPDKTGNDGNDA